MDMITNTYQFSAEIEALVNQNGLNDLDCENVKFIFPITNEDCLMELENRIKTDALYRNLLIRHLSTYRGNRLIHLIKRIMTALFHDTLLAKYSYTGKGLRNKLCFSDLAINKVILCAILVQSNYEDCHTDIEKKIKAYLTQVPYRLKSYGKENDEEDKSQE